MRSSKSPPRLRIGQPNQTDAQLQLHRIDGQIVFDALGALGGLGLFLHRGDRLGLVLAAGERHGHAHAARADQKQRNPRQAGEDQQGQKSARDGQRLRPRKKLPQKLLRQVALLAAPRDQHAGRQRNQEGGNLRDQPVADRKRGEQLAGVARAHARLDDADKQSADDVDQNDDDARDGVAADELAGAVHRAEEVGLLGDLLPATLGLALVDDAGVQVGVDGHLLAGHAVEGESGGHLADARGPLGDDHELDHDDDREDDQADHDIVGRRRRRR